jgi:hypothetical protein
MLVALSVSLTFQLTFFSEFLISIQLPRLICPPLSIRYYAPGWSQSRHGPFDEENKFLSSATRTTITSIT